MVETPTHLKFRYDINALRAIAVVGVLLFHYKVPYISGGFAGVDVFFVISGYLMSKIIISGINKDSFSLSEFYGRRLKRIVPALLFLVLGITIVGFFLYFPNDYKSSEKNSAASILFISNILYWKSTNYFAEASDTNILLHTWSLSVEWQFYLLYPVLLMLIGKSLKKKTRYLIAFVVITLIFFAGAIYYTRVDKNASFYFLPTRCWEMMFGGIAFLSEDLVRNIKGKKLIVIAGYALILACFVLLRPTMPWPGKYTIVPVFATFIIITFSVNEFKILKQEGIQLLGKISYSLYLWHWPVVVFAQYMGVQMTWVAILGMIVLSVLLGYISFKYIESIDFKSNKLILAVMLIFVVCTAAFSVVNVNEIMFKPEAISIADYKTHIAGNGFNEDGCFITSDNEGIKDYDKDRCLKIVPGKKNIILIGDSHAAHLTQSLRAALEKKDVNLMLAATSGCMPIIGQKGKEHCTGIINFVYDSFIRHNADKIDGVIISANWVGVEANKEKVRKGMESTIAYLKKYHIKAIIIGQNETYNLTYPVVKAKELEYNLKLSDRYINKKCYTINNFLKASFKPYYIEIINKKNFPELTLNNTPYMMDKNHFTRYGSDLAVNKILVNPIVTQFLNEKAK